MAEDLVAVEIEIAVVVGLEFADLIADTDFFVVVVVAVAVDVAVAVAVDVAVAVAVDVAVDVAVVVVVSLVTLAKYIFYCLNRT
jgi:hypothetical protein